MKIQFKMFLVKNQNILRDNFYPVHKKVKQG